MGCIGFYCCELCGVVMICGVDEAGRGPVVGPMVIAGVAFESESVFDGLGMRDSKKVAPKRRVQLEKVVRSVASAVEVVVISAEDIDSLRNAMTLNDLEVHGFTKVIEKLPSGICYVDAADVNESRFGRKIQGGLSSARRLVSRHKADDIYPVVGAASIVAQVKRDRLVAEIESELSKKLDLPLGSGYPADPLTRRFLSEWVSCFGDLPPHVRRSWKTAQKILKEKSVRRLDEF